MEAKTEPQQENQKPQQGSFKRQVAVKLYIQELIQGQYEVREGWEPNVVKTSRGNVSRANIVAVIVDKESVEGVTSWTLDDGTGKMVVRSFEQDVSFTVEVGQLVLVIGKPRKYGNEIYIVPEIIRPTDALWGKYRKAELGEPKERSVVIAERPGVQAETVEETNTGLTLVEKMLQIIKAKDSGEGAGMEEVVRESNLPDGERLLDQMLKQGDIFQIKPGRVKVLE